MKNFSKGMRILLIVGVLLLNIGCDQITKQAARNHLEAGEPISIFSSFLTLTKVQNTGAFLSLGSNLPEFVKIPILIIIPCLVLVGMLVYILRKNNMSLHFSLPLAFIIGGGIGNLYDRALSGSVTDFLHMDFYVFQTGIFNLADISIMVGSFWMIAAQLMNNEHRQEKDQAP